MPKQKESDCEREAWLYIARRWDRARRCSCDPHCTSFIAHIESFACEGICVCIDLMPDVDKDVRERMAQKIYAVQHGSLFLYPRTLAGAKKRAAFCRKQAKLLTKGKRK